MRYLSLLIVLPLLAACGSSEKKPDTQMGSLIHNLDLVDKDGKHYGHVEMEPVGGGRIYDNDGRTIGRIVPVEK